MRIAFLGTGLMGAGFVRRMLSQGHEVSVWNRSPDKAKALEAHAQLREGAHVACGDTGISMGTTRLGCRPERGAAIP